MAKKLLVFFGVLILAFVILISWQTSPQSNAQTIPANELAGYGWSSNIGWISFNCLNTDSCATSNYKVTVDAGGNLIGSAWANPHDAVANSKNIGWIQFNPPNVATEAPEDPKHGARIEGNNVTGWARALSGAALDDGWDGWIKMSGSWTNGVTKNAAGTGFAGYAWGDDVIGWVDMSRVTIGSGNSLLVSCSGSESPTVQRQVTWTATATGGTAPYTYQWSGSGGLTGTGPNVQISYSANGTQTASVTATDSSGKTGPGSCSIVVGGGGDPGCPTGAPFDPVSGTCTCPAGTTWNSSLGICEAPGCPPSNIIAGICCPPGTIWNGVGAACTTAPQCSDTVDNDDPEDTLADCDDPGCLRADGSCDLFRDSEVDPVVCDPVADPTCAGTLEIVSGFETIEIRTQPLGQPAMTIVPGQSGTNRLAAQLRAQGGAVSGVGVRSILSVDGSDPLTYTGLELSCQLQKGPTYDPNYAWSPCSSVPTINLASGEIAFFRLKVNRPLKVVDDHDPYKIKIGNSSVSKTIIFDYKVGTFDPI